VPQAEGLNLAPHRLVDDDNSISIRRFHLAFLVACHHGFAANVL
jgi:hypothetical protein